MKHGFELLKKQYVGEIQSQVQLWRHVKSGAEFLSLENQDDNKVFGIAFRTPPPDSAGVIHVLEHATLQGSRRYPIKSPIQALIKGSLKAYVNMNAYPDKTVYPVASRNLKDLHNLADVFLDGVFYPLLRQETFKQEGWHYELEAADVPLRINGVVYNEQKGNFAMPFKRIAVESQKALFPDTPYGHAYGGSPTEIPNLTYEQFKAYFAKYYHPSNARIFWYGDDDPEERLRYLNNWLQDFERADIHSEIPLQPAFSEPRKVVVPYYAGEDADTNTSKGIMTLSWVLAEVGDPELMISYQILAHILLGSAASPVRAALLDSGMGADLAGLGLWTHARQMYFSTGLQGMNPQHFARLEQLVLETLANLSTANLDRDLVAAAMNTVEFQLQEADFGHMPRGLGLLQERALTNWIHGYDPLSLLAFEEPLRAIQARVAAGERYFEELIRSFLLENPHRATVCLVPRSNPSPEKVEREQLEQMAAALSPAEREAIVADTQALLQYQQEPDPPEILDQIPSLLLSDLDRAVRTEPFEVDQVGGCPILFNPRAAHGIVYVDMAFNLHALSQELLPYMPLFGELLVNMGTKEESAGRRAQRIGRQTGGIQSSVMVSAPVAGEHAVGRWVLHGKALQPQAAGLLGIIQDVLLQTCFDDRVHVAQLLAKAKARMEASLAPLGHQFVDTRLGAQYSPAGWQAEQLTGIQQLFFLRQLESELAADWQKVLSKLEAIRRRLVKHQWLVGNLTGEAHALANLKPAFERFVAGLPNAESAKCEWRPLLQVGDQGFGFPSPVNFVAKGANLYQLGYALNGSVNAIVNHVSMNWLFQQIREQGGAYGGRCTFDHLSGMFIYDSYRDPQLQRSLQIYDRTCQFLHDLDLSESERVKSIIGALSRMEVYHNPESSGYTALLRYLTGETDEIRQRRRDELFSVSLQDFRDFAEVLAAVRDKGSVVVLGSQESIEQANVAGEQRLAFVKVL